MSEKDCSEVIHQIFVFIDNELDQATCGEIRQHLDECGPCLAKYNLERTVKSLVARSTSPSSTEGVPPTSAIGIPSLAARRRIIGVSSGP